jgi:thymidylate synthase (FAD)
MNPNPRIYMLSRPHFTDAHQDLLRDFLSPDEARWSESNSPTPAERLVEFAGRVCYMSFGTNQSDRTNREYIQNLIQNGHDSVLEHAVWSFALTGVSRAFTHQLVRHRAGFSYSQLSQQYHDETAARFIRPKELDRHPVAAQIWDNSIDASHRAYRQILEQLDKESAAPARKEKKRALRSAARSVLPNATETVIVVTANARSLRHFLRMRGSIIGDLEMRIVSTIMLEVLHREAPSLFLDFVIKRHEDGHPIIYQLPLR